MPTTLTLGRDPACHVTLADPSVSRRHAELVLLDEHRIFVRDLGGSNGTTLVRQGARHVLDREVIGPGDQVVFGDVPLAFDELREMLQGALGHAPRPGENDAARVAPRGTDPKDADRGRAEPTPGARSASEFVPLGGLGLHARGLLVPGLVFALLVSRWLWLVTGSTDPESTASFVMEFAAALTIVALIVVYRLCGKRKPWAMIAAVMAFEAGVLTLHPYIRKPFCDATGSAAILERLLKAERGAPQAESPAESGGPVPAAASGGGAGGRPSAAPAGSEAKRWLGHLAQPGPPGPVHPPGPKPGFLARFYAFFFCAGLVEELEKMLPVFLLIWLSRRTQRPDAKRWGVHEPLDAIVYACAAAAAFILIETLGDSGYVGGIIAEARQAALVKQDPNLVKFAALVSFPLAIVRTVDALTGHLAYSGYFAYFVGLGLLRPHQRERLWLGGWLFASMIHGLFNAADNAAIHTFATVVAFFFLIGAILKARRVSPTRDENFATRAVSVGVGNRARQ